MGLKGKSFLPRRQKKSKKKLEAQIQEDGLREDIEVAETTEAAARIQLEATQDRLDKSTRAGNILREKIRVRKGKLERILEQQQLALQRVHKLQEDRLANIDACVELDKKHAEEPERRRKLQVQLYRIIRDNESIQTEIAHIYYKVEERFETLKIKGQILREREHEIMKKEKTVRGFHNKIQQQIETRRSHGYHKQRMEAFILYMMKMNLHAVTSRTHMVQRRGQHLVNLIQNLMNEVEKTVYRTLDMRKRKCETRSPKQLQNNLKFSEVEVGLI